MSTGSVQGWVNRDDLSPISQETLNELVEKEQKRGEIEDAVKRKEVIFGMTREQVERTLGRPQDKSLVREEEAVSETWTYYTYKSVPFMQSYGTGTNVVTQVYTQKVPIGSKKITFQNGVVVRIEQKSENVPSGIQMPPAPYPPPVYRIPKTQTTTPGS
jgi:outer membrane protein assembly factor BamE (lipoprotein component of BamABCDE complex)